MDRLEELILYIAQKSANDPAFSDTKLNKILFLADFSAYGHWGESITGSRYIHNHYGPTPREMMPARRELERDGRLQMQESEYYDKTQNKPVATSNPDLTMFTKEQIQLVDETIEKYRHYSASDLSEETHTYLPWLATEQGEEIPYEAVFVLKKIPVGRDDMLWAERILAERE